MDLHWRQIGVLNTIEHPQSPFFVQWESPEDHHPAFGGERTGIRVLSMEINCPTQDLGPMATELAPLTDLITWVNDTETDEFGVNAVTFETPQGHVRID